MKKSLVIMLLVVVIASLSLMACTSPAPNAAPATVTVTVTSSAPAPAPTATAAPKIKAVKLKAHNWGPPRSLLAGFEWWEKEVTARSGGAITFENLYSAALVQSADQLDGVKNKLFDIGAFHTGFAASKTPLWSVILLRYMGTTGDVGAYCAAQAEFAEFAPIKAEMDKWNGKYLLTAGSCADEYIGVKQVKTVADFKGVRVWTTANAELMKNVGAVPVAMNLTEIYEAVSRGTIDGAILNFDSSGSFGLADAAKYATFTGTGCVGWPFIINKDVWNSLEPEAQKIMMDTAAIVPDKYGYLANSNLVDWIQKFAVKVQINNLSETERAKMRDTGVKPTWDKWIKDNGPEAQSVFDAWRAALAKYKG